MVEFRVHITEVNTSDSRRVNHTCWFEVNHVLEEEESAQCQLIVASQLGRILPNCNQERGEDSEVNLFVCLSVHLSVIWSVSQSVLYGNTTVLL